MNHQAATPPAIPAAIVAEALWRRFAEAGDDVSAWLALQCAMLPGVRAALVLLEGDDSAAFAPVAAWPPAADFTALQAVAERTIAAGEGVVTRAEDGLAHAGYPVALDGHVCALVLLALDADDDGVQRALRDLHWGIAWLEAHILRGRAREDRGRLERAAMALDILAVAGEHDRLEAAAQAVANEAALRLSCDRVAIGVAPRARPIRLLALSNIAWFRRRAGVIAGLENAMEEARDQAASIAWPAIPGLARGITVAHRAHVAAEGASGLLTVVLSHRGVPVGAMALERRGTAGFDRATLQAAEAIADLLGPLLELERRQRRWLAGRLPDAAGRLARRLFGARHPALKLGALAAVGLVAFLVLFEAPFRISARATLEGAQQRVAAAPFQGFVATARARPGDEVRRGDVLAELDEQDLRLDMTRWRAEYARLVQEKRKALAGMDRTESALVDAQIEQARAQLELTTIKLERARILAPIDGVIVSGDWSHKLGAPVEQGATMFEIATLESFRVSMRVEEADIAHVRPGQSGHVLLAGRADAALGFTVTRLTSVASVEDGQNQFRVEATLTEGAGQIRPGMEGVGKIEVDSRPIGWIWSRRIVDWLRLAAWRNLP